ncbi:hypothetical protein ACW73L_17230 [Methylolobus aquaticus]
MKAALEAIRQVREQGFSLDLQARVIDAELAYRFACAAEEADLDALEPLVLQSTDPRLMFDFAMVKGERGQDVARLQDAVIGSGNPGLVLLFAADVAGADRDLLEDAVRNHPDPKYLYSFETEMRQKGYY